MVAFIAVGTPPADDGSADLKYVEAAARGVGLAMDGYRVIVDKSTVPIGTARKVRLWVSEELARRGVEYGFDVVSNPEFLREGTAVYDFQGGARCVRAVAQDSTRQPCSQTLCVCGAQGCAVGAQRPRSSPNGLRERLL